MFIPLFLFKNNLISSPMFYISAFFETNRDEYYERLRAVSKDGNWMEWCTFFLHAVTTQALANQQKATEILQLYENKKRHIVELTHSQYAIHALDFLFARPIFKATEIAGNKNIPSPTAKRIVSVLRDQGILKTLREASGSRPAVYAFQELLNTAEGQEVF